MNQDCRAGIPIPAVSRGLLGILAAFAAFVALGLTQRPVGAAMVELDSRRVEVSESNLGDLVADAIRAATKADLALVNASELRAVRLSSADLPTQLDQVLTYPDDPVTVVSLPGSAVRAALERSLSLAPRPYKGLLQVAGMRVTFDSRRPSGKRVALVTLPAGLLDPSRTYRVAMPRSLARGSLGYFRVFSGFPVTDTGLRMLDAVRAYLATPGAAEQKVDGRLKDMAPK